MSRPVIACAAAVALFFAGADAPAQWLDLEAPPAIGDAAAARAASLAESLSAEAEESRLRASAMEEGTPARVAASARAAWRELAAHLLGAADRPARGPTERGPARDLAFGVRLVAAIPSLDALAASVESGTDGGEAAARRAAASLEAFARSVDRLVDPAAPRAADAPAPDWRRDVAWPFDAAAAMEETAPADPWPAAGGGRMSAGEARARLQRAGLTDEQASRVGDLLDALERAEGVVSLCSLAAAEIGAVGGALEAIAGMESAGPIDAADRAALLEHSRRTLAAWASARLAGRTGMEEMERGVSRLREVAESLRAAGEALDLGMPSPAASEAAGAIASAATGGLSERGARALGAMRGALVRSSDARAATRGRDATSAGRLAWRTLGEEYTRAESAAMRDASAALRDPDALERPATISAISVHADLAAALLRTARMIEFAESLSVERRMDAALGDAAQSLRGVLDALGDPAQRAWAMRRLERIERVEAEIGDALRAIEAMSLGSAEAAALRARVEPALVESRAAWRRTWDDGADAPDPSALARLALALRDAGVMLDDGAPSGLALRWPGLTMLGPDIRDEAARAAREIRERLGAAVSAPAPEREMLARGAEETFAMVRLAAAIGRALDGLGAATQSGATGALARLAVEPGDDVWLGGELARLDEVGALLFQLAEAERTESAGAAAEARERAAPLCEAALRAIEVASMEDRRR